MTFKNQSAQTLFDSIKTFAENVPVYNLAKDLRAAGLSVPSDVADDRMLKNLVGDLLKELAKVQAAEVQADAELAESESEPEVQAYAEADSESEPEA